MHCFINGMYGTGNDVSRMEDTQACEKNGTSKSTPATVDRGTAAIKDKYLITREQFHKFIDAGGEETHTDLSADGVSEEAPPDSTHDHDTAEPETKKIKLSDTQEDCREQNIKENEGTLQQKRARGQNKRRPYQKPTVYVERNLCPSIKQECASKCFFGDKCKYLHDINQYMAEKSAEIGEKCYLFETFGKCIYGVTCRFAKSHLGENYKNVVNEEVQKLWANKELVKNQIDKDLQHRLRKRKVSFEKSEKYLKQMNTSSKSGPVESEGRDLEPPQPEVKKSVDTTTVLKEKLNVSTESLKTETHETVSQEAPGSPVILELSLGAQKDPSVKTIGPLTDEDIVKTRLCEKKKIDFKNKLYLAPLTTCGNLPFRRICKRYGADITCGEMAMCSKLLQGQTSEWALMKRHHTEDLFGVQLEGSFPDTMTRCAELLNKSIEVDFVDINVGCPIDLVFNMGGGCALMNRTRKFEQIVKGMNSVLDVPLTVKIRTGVQENANLAHKLIPNLKQWGVSLITLHGRSKEQRYTKLADWEYINHCAALASPVPLFGNGDILSYEDANRAMKTDVSGIMIARGALVKPWLFTEIKEQRHWDISSKERLDVLQDFTNFGLEHWGSDTQGVEKTRKFMLEWLSFLCRYIPVGLLEHVPQKINERPPYYMGRDYLETLMASQNANDWIKISEMLLGPVPQNFTFLPKHKANSYK
ncbi:tRNA-dihydrouridine(47) synthase [NAD(P)(+)]-like isoform X1 [Pleurodeles waltl]|uniref:tRNA-dihydrouridine(47) synthase [NAD(P)(+)]-like isoform X1 n=2 Tax=Pleurodeles waltl TaxID=8319 RepID=UPI003709757C